MPTIRSSCARFWSGIGMFSATIVAFGGSAGRKDQVAGLNHELTAQAVAEAAFALLYFQNPTDLIPDSIPGMGLLDDAMIVGMVLRRHEHSFRRSSHSSKLHWPIPSFEVDELLSVISPLRVSSFSVRWRPGMPETNNPGFYQ
jgi:hypothetical protein